LITVTYGSVPGAGFAVFLDICLRMKIGNETTCTRDIILCT
jgi:hypothetical protein